MTEYRNFKRNFAFVWVHFVCVCVCVRERERERERESYCSLSFSSVAHMGNGGTAVREFV